MLLIFYWSLSLFLIPQLCLLNLSSIFWSLSSIPSNLVALSSDSSTRSSYRSTLSSDASDPHLMNPLFYLLIPQLYLLIPQVYLLIPQVYLLIPQSISRFFFLLTSTLYIFLSLNSVFCDLTPFSEFPCISLFGSFHLMIPAFAFLSLYLCWPLSFIQWFWFCFFSQWSASNNSTLTSDQKAPFFDPFLVPLI